MVILDVKPESHIFKNNFLIFNRSSSIQSLIHHLPPSPFLQISNSAYMGICIWEQFYVYRICPPLGSQMLYMIKKNSKLEL